MIRERCKVMTASGRLVDVEDFRPEDLDTGDVIHSLSNLCRYNGHTKYFYSVAQHSVFVSQLGTTRDAQLWGLVHDWPEAYLGDIVRPIKARMPGIEDLEMRILHAIGERLGLCWPIPSEVWRNDNAMLSREVLELTRMPLATMTHTGNIPPAEVPLVFSSWAPEVARTAMRDRLVELKRQS